MARALRLKACPLLLQPSAAPFLSLCELASRICLLLWLLLLRLLLRLDCLETVGAVVQPVIELLCVDELLCRGKSTNIHDDADAGAVTAQISTSRFPKLCS